MLTGRRGFLGQLVALVFGAKAVDTLRAPAAEASKPVYRMSGRFPRAFSAETRRALEESYNKPSEFVRMFPGKFEWAKNLSGSTAETYRKHWERARGS